MTEGLPGKKFGFTWILSAGKPARTKWSRWKPDRAINASTSWCQVPSARCSATLIATDVPIGQVLAEWARIGGTKIVNGERVVGPNLTLQLVDRPEREVLDAVLRTAAGFLAAPRSAAVANLSVYDRILIIPTSQAPAYNPAAVSAPMFTPHFLASA